MKPFLPRAPSKYDESDQSQMRSAIEAAFQRIGFTGGPLAPPHYTTTQRNALSPRGGDIIYNTTTSKAQIYEGGVWKNLIGDYGL